MSRGNPPISKVDEFGVRLTQVRETLGLNKKEFAKKVGSSQAHISQVERGITKPSRLFITAVCNTFFVNQDFLLAAKKPMFVQSDEAIKRLVGPKYQMLSDLGFLAHDGPLDEVPEELLALVHNMLRIHRHQWATVEKIVEAFCNQVGIEYERPGRPDKEKESKEEPAESEKLELNKKAG